MSGKGQAELSVTFQLFADDEPLTTPTCTAAGTFEQGTVVWGETLFFPIKYRDLSGNARLDIKVWNARNIRRRELIGEATFRLFDEHRSLLRGNQRIPLTRTHEGGNRDSAVKTRDNIDVDGVGRYEHSRVAAEKV